MDIMGAPSAPLDVVQRKLREQNRPSYFIDVMVPELFKAAQLYGIDPVVMVAQSAKETAWGTFPGKVKQWFNNTAGIKVAPQEQALYPGITDGDNPLAHARFATVFHGAKAHAMHLRAYAGSPVPADEVVHARYWVVPLAHVRTVEGLSGRWAPSPSYGSEIVSIARTLIEVGL